MAEKQGFTHMLEYETLFMSSKELANGFATITLSYLTNF